jgi:hypothetical protein
MMVDFQALPPHLRIRIFKRSGWFTHLRSRHTTFWNRVKLSIYILDNLLTIGWCVLGLTAAETNQALQAAAYPAIPFPGVGKFTNMVCVVLRSLWTVIFIFIYFIYFITQWSFKPGPTSQDAKNPGSNPGFTPPTFVIIRGGVNPGLNPGFGVLSCRLWTDFNWLIALKLKNHSHHSQWYFSCCFLNEFKIAWNPSV